MATISRSPKIIVVFAYVKVHYLQQVIYTVYNGFSKPVLEALLNYKEPDTLERDLLDMGYERTAIAMEIAKANSSQVLNKLS